MAIGAGILAAMLARRGGSGLNLGGNPVVAQAKAQEAAGAPAIQKAVQLASNIAQEQGQPVNQIAGSLVRSMAPQIKKEMSKARKDKESGKEIKESPMNDFLKMRMMRRGGPVAQAGLLASGVTSEFNRFFGA